MKFYHIYTKYKNLIQAAIIGIAMASLFTACPNPEEIRAQDDNSADLKHSALLAKSGHKVDSIEPSVQEVIFFIEDKQGSLGPITPYKEDGEIKIKITFSEPVKIDKRKNTTICEGYPYLTLKIGENLKNACVQAHDRFADIHWWTYQIKEGDIDIDGVTLYVLKFRNLKRSITNKAGNSIKNNSFSYVKRSKMLKKPSTSPFKRVFAPLLRVRLPLSTIKRVKLDEDGIIDYRYKDGDSVYVSVVFKKGLRIKKPNGRYWKPQDFRKKDKSSIATITLRVNGTDVKASFYKPLYRTSDSKEADIATPWDGSLMFNRLDLKYNVVEDSPRGSIIIPGYAFELAKGHTFVDFAGDPTVLAYETVNTRFRIE